MVLIECYECESKISHKTEVCPQCGALASDSPKAVELKKEVDKKMESRNNKIERERVKDLRQIESRSTSWAWIIIFAIVGWWSLANTSGFDILLVFGLMASTSSIIGIIVKITTSIEKNMVMKKDYSELFKNKNEE